MSGTSHRFVATLEKSDNRLWGCHLRVPRPIALKLNGGRSRRVVRSLNGSEDHHCALLPYRKGSVVVAVNRQWQKKLGLAPGMRVTVKLRKDESRYGLPMPEEFEELLKQDKDGNELFHALTPGRQRTLLYYIGKPADPRARAERSVIVVRQLSESGGRLNWRRLIQSFRRP